MIKPMELSYRASRALERASGNRARGRLIRYPNGRWGLCGGTLNLTHSYSDEAVQELVDTGLMVFDGWEMVSPQTQQPVSVSLVELELAS